MKDRKQNYIQPRDLSGRQSVRTTFRFSKEANEALNWLSKRYGVPMKDVLHSAIEELVDHSQEKGGPTPSRRSTNDLQEKDIMTIALRARVILSKPDNGVKMKDGPDLTVRRTVVATKKTLKTLKRLSEENKVTRDYIINSAILFAKNFTITEIPRSL
jgi:primosomal protein N'